MNLWNKLRTLCLRLRIEEVPDIWVPVSQAAADLRISESSIRSWGKREWIQFEKMPRFDGKLIFAVNLREVQKFNKSRMISEVRQ